MWRRCLEPHSLNRTQKRSNRILLQPLITPHNLGKTGEREGGKEGGREERKERERRKKEKTEDQGVIDKNIG